MYETSCNGLGVLMSSNSIKELKPLCRTAMKPLPVTDCIDVFKEPKMIDWGRYMRYFDLCSFLSRTLRNFANFIAIHRSRL